MEKMKLYLALLSTISLEAGSLGKVFDNVAIDGYLRGTYQLHDVQDDRTYQDDAIGAKLHFGTKPLNGISVGASLYSSNALFHNDNRGLIPLRGENHASYAILGEAYLKAEFGKSMLTIGRQEIETPFAQVDDIGMVPNTFEAVILESHIVEDTTLFLGQIQKMAGVDASTVDTFTKINGSENMQLLGVRYEGISNVTLDGWYYNLKNAEVNTITFLEADYEKELDDMTYNIGFQYANQGYHVGKSANIFGGTVGVTANKLGVTVSTAYTEVHDNVAFSGFGGGPFYSNSEYLILDNAGKEGKATWVGSEYDASKVGVEGLTVGLGYITLANRVGKKSTELDLTASYEINDAIEIYGVASKLKGANIGEDDAKHLRVFANYNF